MGHIPIVPHKAAAEVSRVGKPTGRVGLLSRAGAEQAADGATGGWSVGRVGVHVLFQLAADNMANRAICPAIYPCMRLSSHLSVYLYLSIYPSIHPSIHLPIDLILIYLI